jgi:lambda family phage minor tail protein L
MSTPQSIQEQLQSLEPSAIIELFQLELTQAVNGVDQTYYYHAGTNELTADVVFNGLTYTATAIEVDGFQASTKGVFQLQSSRIRSTT